MSLLWAAYVAAIDHSPRGYRTLGTLSSLILVKPRWRRGHSAPRLIRSQPTVLASLVSPAWPPKSVPRRQLIRPFVRALSHLPGYRPVMKNLHNLPHLALRAQNHPHCLIGMRRYSSGILPETPNESRIGTPGLVQHWIMRWLARRSLDTRSTRLAELL